MHGRPVPLSRFSPALTILETALAATLACTDAPTTAPPPAPSVRPAASIAARVTSRRKAVVSLQWEFRLATVRAINTVGQAVGHTDPAVGGPEHATLWDLGTGQLRDLGVLEGAFQSAANALNDAGQVVGVSALGEGTRHAFRWDALTGMIDLGTLGGASSEAVAIDAAGRVVGSSETASGETHAFLWEPGTGMRDLGTLGGRSSAARAVNVAGQVVGQSETAAGQVGHAFLWDASAGMRDLGAFTAFRITDAGQVVGVRDGHVVQWEAGVGFTDLGAIEGIDEVRDVNAAGQVVGVRQERGLGPCTNFHAALWQRGIGSVDLDPFLAPTGIQDICVFGTFAAAVNDAGHVAGGSEAGVHDELPFAIAWNVTILDDARPIVEPLFTLERSVVRSITGLDGDLLRFRLHDRSADGPWRLVIDWGDCCDANTPPPVSRLGDFLFLHQEPYSDPGPHTVTVVAIDKDGAASPRATLTLP